jgi:translation elongation factor P/translation initiation factor 5A
MKQALRLSLNITTLAFILFANGFTPTARPRFTLGRKNYQQGLKRLTPLGLSTADFKNGLTIEVDGTPMRVVEFLHVKPGKGSAFVRTKLKNLLNNQQLEKTWRAGESVEAADVNNVDVQFTYEDGSNFAFMNMESFEELLVPASTVDDVSGSNFKIVECEDTLLMFVISIVLMRRAGGQVAQRRHRVQSSYLER